MTTLDYWNRRYLTGGRSGERRLPDSALQTRYRWRAGHINQIARVHRVESVLDIGCGDGRQAELLDLPDYLGVDPSLAAVFAASLRCPDKTFDILDEPEPRDLHLSLSVLFHLTSDADYRHHMALLFSARRLAVVHATDRDEPGADHVLHRRWTPDVPEGWTLAETVDADPPGSTLTVWTRA